MIIYAAIGRVADGAILAECVDVSLRGNFTQATTTLFEYLRDQPQALQEGDRKTFVQKDDAENDFFSKFIDAACAAMGDEIGAEETYFHLYRRDDVIYACLGDDADSRAQKVNFACLEAIHSDFSKLFRTQRIANANAYAMDNQFKPNMRSILHYHNTNHDKLAQEDKVRQLMAQVDDLKSVVGRNINLALDRGDKLESLVDKSEILLADASVFKKRAQRSRARQQRKFYLTVAIWTVAVLVIMYLMVIGVCGIGLQQCRTAVVNAKNQLNDDN